jgi:hypothetical protein
MWPFSKKQPIFREISREYLGYKMEPCMGRGGMGTDVDTFSIWAVTLEDVETGKRKVEKQLKLEF